MKQKKIEYSNLPSSIQTLVTKRNELRTNGKFDKSDQIRNTLEEEGYAIQDTDSGIDIYQIIADESLGMSLLSIMGSGETQDTGRLVHDYVLNTIGRKDVKIAILSTPAGFQPNVKVVYEEYKEFFEKRLKNYHPQVSIVYANNKDRANDPNIIEPVNNADYIVTGPGSPTYAVKHLKDTLLLKEIVHQVTENYTSLSLSSAAAIAFSKYALPV